MNSLKSLGTLSENFINFESNRLTKCKLYIENYDWDKFNTSTIYEVTDDTPCSCFLIIIGIKVKKLSMKQELCSIIEERM